MNTEIQNQILHYIQNEWQNLEGQDKPWGLWISAHESLPSNTSHLDTLAYKAWFLDRAGLKQHDIWEYARFITIHKYKPWSSRIYKEATNNIFAQIGLAAFAEFHDSNDFYLERILGGFKAMGYRFIINSNGVIEIKDELWVS